jgi:hypothetical protein
MSWNLKVRHLCNLVVVKSINDNEYVSHICETLTEKTEWLNSDFVSVTNDFFLLYVFLCIL